jgi:sporulation protein YlmC with PRC-barrel domain
MAASAERATVARISAGQVFVTIGRLTPGAATPVTVPAGMVLAVGDDVVVLPIAGSIDDLVVIVAL